MLSFIPFRAYNVYAWVYIQKQPYKLESKDYFIHRLTHGVLQPSNL